MSNLPNKDEEQYLGDGVYVSFDGYNVILRMIGEENHVLLNPFVCSKLYGWLDSYPGLHHYYKE